MGILGGNKEIKELKGTLSIIENSTSAASLTMENLLIKNEQGSLRIQQLEGEMGNVVKLLNVFSEQMIKISNTQLALTERVNELSNNQTVCGRKMGEFITTVNNINELIKETNKGINNIPKDLINGMNTEEDSLQYFKDLKHSIINNYLYYQKNVKSYGNEMVKHYRGWDKYMFNGESKEQHLLDGYIMPYFKEWISNAEDITSFRVKDIKHKEAVIKQFLEILAVESGGMALVEKIYEDYQKGTMGKEDRKFLEELNKEFKGNAYSLKKYLASKLSFKYYKNEKLAAYITPSFDDFERDKKAIKRIVGGFQGAKIRGLYEAFEERYNNGNKIKPKLGTSKIDTILSSYQTKNHQLVDLAEELFEK